MMTPDMNARIVEVELAYRRATPKNATWWTVNPTERRQAPMKLYAKYLRYALSSLVNVAFGLAWN